MGRKSAKTGGAAQLKPKPAAKSKKVESESEAESDASESFMQFKRGKKHDSDEEEDREVFNLAMNDDDSENEDGTDDASENDDDDDEDSQADSEEDEDDDDYEGDDLRNLVDNLPQNLRQKVLMKKGDEDSESEAEESEEEEEGWGKKKSTYWSGDTADLEIGQSMEDAEEEEAAAQELQKGKLAKMKASDFYEEFDNDESEEESEAEEDEEEQNMGSKLKNKKQAAVAAAETKVSAKTAKKLLKKTISSGSNDDKVIADLELIALGKSNASDVQVEKLQKDISKLSKQQKLDLLQAQSPELLGIVNELKERVHDLKNNLQPLKEFLQKVAQLTRVSDDIVEYLEVKEQLLLAYCTNVVFYLYMKAQGKSVRAHPVMKQLLKLRYVMEKMRPLDNKLKYQIDRLVKLSELSPQEAAGQVAGLLRPNPAALMGRDGGDSDSEGNSNDDEGASDSEDDSAHRGKGKKSNGSGGDGVELYRAPKISSMPYEEAETQNAKRDSKMEKQRKKLRHSELMDTLREEFGSAPELAGSGGLGRASGDLRALQEEAEERKRFEEERFVRMTMSRKDKKDIKRRTAEATRLDNFDDIGDIGDFEEFAKMARQSSGVAEDGSLAEALSKKGGSRKNGLEEEGERSGKSTAAALQRAVDALQGGGGDKSKKNGKKGGSDDALVMPGERKKISVEDVAAALSGGMGGGDFSDDEMDFAPPAKSKKNGKKNNRPDVDAFGDSDGEVDPYSAFLEGESRKRRRAPEGRMNDFEGGDSDGDNDDDNLVEEFGQKKKAFLNKKKEHYTAELRYGGREETVGEDKKRAATYEIMKNKGLTPHRKKEARNPRVMKRMKYEKAQIARKGQVREVIKGAAGAYGGEMTGIKSGISRSRRIATESFKRFIGTVQWRL